MRRRSLLATLILILAFALPVAVAADDPPGPTTRHQFRVDGLPGSGPMEVVTFINEYVPGAQTVPHLHPGMSVGTLIEGENTCICGAKSRTYKLGETLIELPSDEPAIYKNTGATRARVMGSIVLPKGAAPSIPQPGAPASPPPTPVSLYFYRTDALIPAGGYEVAHTVLDFAPGAQTPLHTHPGQVVVTVIEGAITFTAAGTTKVYQVGETFVELPGVVAQARNAGSAKAAVMVVSLLPKGAPLSEPVAPTPPATGTGGNLPGLPSTGAGGGAERPPVGWLLLAAGGALAVGGTLLKRRARRA